MSGARLNQDVVSTTQSHYLKPTPTNSIVTHSGKPQIAYSTAKAALLSFSRATAVIYAEKGVRINTVVPGLINTPLVKMLADKYAGGDYKGYVETRNKQVPMGRMGTAWDVANAALFLASREANYITGTEIIVDGGIVQSTGRT